MSHYHFEIFSLSRELNKIAAPAEPEEAAYWINTPDGDYSREFCSTCGEAKVAELKAQDPDRANEYDLDGGFTISHDHTVACDVCGVRLAGNLSDYGAAEEIEHFSENGFHCYDADEAYEICDALENYQYESDNEKPEVKLLRAEAIRLANEFLIGWHFRNVRPLLEWADDGGRCPE